MQKHTKNYFSYFGFVESDFIKCENCSCAAVDIHHIKPRSSFVHATGLIDKVRENDPVSFELEKGKKGVVAVNVKKTN